MTIILFFIILSVLVLVHEAGHFFVAKWDRVRVDEFGLGYPPRAKKLFSWRGTDFTLNWLPFGGFVKIYGENPADDTEELSSDNFQTKNRGLQAAVLVAGVAMNLVFAWFLMSVGFMTGLPAPAGLDLPVTDTNTVITTVLPGSPAERAGLKSGNALVSLSRGASSADLEPAAASQFIGVSTDPVTFIVSRGENMIEKTIRPEEGVVTGRLGGVGIALDTVGIVKLPFVQAVIEGLKATAELTWLTAKALAVFIIEAFMGQAELSQVTGPVGLVGMVGDVRVLGLGYIISFTALISINLALVNLLPIPALDGGRLLIVGIEAIRRRAISPKIFNMLNTISFALLLLLMVIITVRDVGRLL